MHRRDFCKLLAITAASKAVPSPRRAAPESQPGLPSGFNQFTQDYAQFCALPPEKRIFYKVSDGKIVEERLDEAAWQPPAWNYNPTAQSIAGGLWDDVPLSSPIPDLAGDGPFKPTWDSLLEYEAPDWYQDAKFGIWAHWSPQCVAEAGDWYARNMYIEDQGQYKYQLEHFGPPSRFGYKDLCAQWTLLNWDPDELITRYKNAGAKIFVALANHHDSFDAWDSKHQPWNAAADRSASRCNRRLGCGSAKAGSAIWRDSASGAQLVVVPTVAWRRHSPAPTLAFHMMAILPRRKAKISGGRGSILSDSMA